MSFHPLKASVASFFFSLFIYFFSTTGRQLATMCSPHPNVPGVARRRRAEVKEVLFPSASALEEKRSHFPLKINKTGRAVWACAEGQAKVGLFFLKPPFSLKY